MCDKRVFIIYMNFIYCNGRLTVFINATMVTNVLLFNDLKIIGNRSEPKMLNKFYDLCVMVLVCLKT